MTTSHWPQLVDLLARHGVTCVLDVGANAGQYATRLRHAGFRGRIVSFEPGAEAHAALTQAAAADPDWQTAPRAAVGAAAGTLTLNVSPESDMSSLLPFTAEARRHMDSATFVGTETVDVVALADVWAEHVRADDRAFLKSDTQGYEAQVLAGLGARLDELAGVQLECSLVPVYAGQPDWRELLDRLATYGLVPHLIVPGYYSRHYGRMVEFDAVCFREADLR